MRITQLAAVAAAVAIGAGVSASAQQSPTVFDPGITLDALSNNGAYAIGMKSGDQDADNPKGAGGTLIDLKTHKSTEIPAPTGWAEVSDVADDATVVGSESGKPGYWRPGDATWTTFDVDAKWGGGSFLAVTPDAKYAVGYLWEDGNPYSAHPMYYDLATGESKALKNLPTRDLSGLDQHQNVFYGVSPDGRYVLGQMSQSYWLPVGLFSYVYDMHTDEWTPIGFDYNAKTGKFTALHPDLYFTSTQYMSADGTWVTGNAYMVKDGGQAEGGGENFYPYRYNVLTKEFEVYYGDNDVEIGANKITADGVVLGSSPYGNPYPTAQIRSGKFFISLDQVLKQVYGLEPAQLIGDHVTGAFQSLSADGLTALMVSYDYCYVLTMPEPFADAAAKVDLLANYTLSIPAGASISMINEVALTFDRSVECLNYPKNITLTDSKGNTVRSALSFATAPDNDRRVLLTFRSTTLNPGENYTINIPAEMIWLKEDPARKTRALTISYVGRNAGPISVKSVSPASGSALAQLNTTPDNISVTFDTPVAVSSTGSCTLYNADDMSVVTAMSAAVNGNTVVFYPQASHMLYKGSNYKVVISAGTVTDLSGQGGCDEIVLEYSGAYVRQLTDDDVYIYHSSCDDYNNFIFWQSEFNEPASAPASWGFTAQNPWLLVRDNNESTDWALAAHSMFRPAGESDDWLITPQLYIPDEKAVLQFDAQRYLNAKADRLKVYIYESDAVYNYFTMDLENAFKAEGDLVMDEVVPAGATDGNMDGEWTSYTIDLKKYAGKNIYIAFVNNNYDQSAIFIDDVKVMRDMNFVLTNQTPVSVVLADNAAVQGIISIGSQIAEFNGINLRLLGSDGSMIDEIDDPTVTLKYGDTYNFSFRKPLSLEQGVENMYTITVKSGDQSTTFRASVKNLVFEPVKRVVLEEYTGSSCPNCPLGINAIENLLKLYPDNFIPVTLRTYGSDMYGMAAQEYTTFLGLANVGAPSAKINRGEPLFPMLQNGSAGYTFFGRGIIQSDGTEAYLWADAVQDELNVPTDADLSFAPSYDLDRGDLEIPVTMKFAINQTGKSYGLFAIVVEDQLPTYQDNNLHAIADPNLGEWGQGGIYSQARVTTWRADDVTRFVVNGFNGDVVPESDFVAGNEYSFDINSVIPDRFISNPANCHVVVMLIDRATGKIVNANKASLLTSGISDVIGDNEAEAEYFDLQGIKVDNPAPGHVYILKKGTQVSKIRY